MKRSNWYKGKDSKDESWTGLPKSRPGGRISKLSQPRRRKRFLKAGKETKSLVAATVIFVPSTKGSILLNSLKEDEDQMAELTGFRVKYQEAGGVILANSFNKDLGKGRHCGRACCPHVTSQKEE